MTYIQRQIPLPNKVFNFTLKSFSGGLNNRSDQLEVNESSNLMNMIFTDETLMEKRKGTEYYDAVDITEVVGEGEAAVTYADVVWQDEFKPYNEDNIYIRAVEKKIYFGSTAYTISSKPCGVNHDGKYFFTDGAKIYVYGKFPQIDDGSVIDVVGTPNPNYVLMEVENPTAGYTPNPAPATVGKTIYNYTTSKIQYQPCAAEIADTYFGANVLPLNPKYICSYNGRLVVTGCDKDDDNIFLTSTVSPYYFPVTMPVQIPPTSDKITGIIEYDGAIILSRDNDLYVLRGLTNNPTHGLEVFNLKRINSHTGVVSNGAMCLVNNYLFFLGSDGNIYFLSSSKSNEKIVSTVLVSRKIDLYKEPINLTISDFVDAESIFYKDEWYLAIKDKIIIYNYRNQAFTLFDSINARSFYNLDGTLLIGNNDGRIVKFSTNYLDNGAPFLSKWISKYFDMDDANTYKLFKEFFIVAHCYNSYLSDVNIVFEIDYNNVFSSTSVPNKTSTFGRAVFGDRFVVRNINASLPFIVGMRGRNIRFNISNGYKYYGEVATIADLGSTTEKVNGETVAKVTADGKYYLYDNFVWSEITDDEMNQPMKIYQINGEYEVRGKR